MNKLLNLAAALLFAGTSLAIAADAPGDKAAADAAEHCQHPMGPMGGMMPGKALPAETMAKMQEQMAKIRQTSDPAERKTLMQEHFQSMQEAMQAMHTAPAAGNAMEGMPCPQNCAKSKTGNACRKSASCRRAGMQGTATPPAAGVPQMQQRMDMMQTMMENMLEHQRQMQQDK
ncbi:MAG: hypothetical protein KGZ83_19070 [Sulfuricella sp.]|nr:hypothetical protein [Sulfuricella sp.]